MESTPALGSVGTVRVVRHPGGSLGRVVVAGHPGWRRGHGDEWGARGSESRPPHRCVQAVSRVARPVRAAPSPAPSVVSATDTRGSRRAGSTGRVRSESRAIAVRVRSWSSPGVPWISSWLQKSSSSVRPREATAVAAGVGDGGLAMVGRPAPAKGVARVRYRRRCRARPAREEPLDGGRRLWPWQPPTFTGRRGKRSWWSGSQWCTPCPGLRRRRQSRSRFPASVDEQATPVGSRAGRSEPRGVNRVTHGERSP